MRLLSIDVGIKNLAYCLFITENENENEKDTNSILIEKWGIVDLSREKEMIQSVKSICSCFCKSTKKEKKCNSIAKWKKDENLYCMKHAKQEECPYLLPTPQLKTSYLQKQNITTLRQLLEKYKIISEKPLLKKENMVELLTTHIKDHLLESLSLSTNTNASDVDLVTIGKNMKSQFNSLFVDIKIDRVIIENQISPIASRMKTIQGMIAQYFIMTSSDKENIIIDFVNSSNKLKLSTTETITLTKTYKDRKKEGIQLVRNNLESPIWVSYFEQHKKKDDLADCYLQGIWYVKNKLSP